LGEGGLRKYSSASLRSSLEEKVDWLLRPMAEPMHEREVKMELENFLNKPVTVTAKDGRKFRGKLVQYDEHMNLLLEGAEELSKEQATKHKFMIIKGGNVSDISV
jgi:small nuclear ribonucleoprotein (snRNP)-like protein